MLAAKLLRYFLASCLLIAACAPAWAQFPPAPLVKLAVNPVTNKVYALDEANDALIVLDASTGATRTVAVGDRPVFIAVNPATNRIYVNNAGDSSLTVIDGATDTNLTPTPLTLGSLGPMAVNTATNMVYVVRLTGPGTDEVTYFNGATHTWYTIATQSYQPIALSVDPATNTLYVAHYSTGDVRVISAANTGNAHPDAFSIGVWSKPFAIAANPVTRKVYVLTEDSRGPIAIIDGLSRVASFPAITPGHALGPKSIAVNAVTNKIYAVFSNEVIVIDGATGGLTYIPVFTGM
jgi:YVTN family beta-propeller protein